MMKKVLTLTITTVRELIREKFFVVGIVTAGLLVALSYLLGKLSFLEQLRILFNIGTLGIELVLLGIGLFASSSLINREIELRTCQIVLTRPVSRSTFLMGKWLGLTFFQTITAVILSLVLFLLAIDEFSTRSFIFITSQILLKTIVLMSVSFFMGLSLRPVLASLIGVCVYLLGHALESIEFLVRNPETKEIPAWFQIFAKFVPRFDHYNWKSFYFIENGVSSENFILMLTHYTSWILILLTLSLIVWRRKDIG
jgi:ABC-type transport system involved in multi-copper enzyme maturation permease subunit